MTTAASGDVPQPTPAEELAAAAWPGLRRVDERGIRPWALYGYLDVSQPPRPPLPTPVYECVAELLRIRQLRQAGLPRSPAADR